MTPAVLAKQEQMVDSALRLLQSGSDQRAVLNVVYQAGRMEGLLEMCRLADKLKQNSDKQARKAA